METPLESNKFIGERKKAIDAGKDSFVVDGKTYKVTGSPATMVGVDPMTGMVQQSQFAPSPINPTALGGLQNQIPNLVGQSVPGSFDRVLPQGMYNNAQEAITAKTNSRMAQALGGVLSPFSQSTYGMLGAKTSKDAAEAERKRKEAQEKARKEKEKKDKKNNKK
tara:strand:+ start:27 stop:521 length:495 start_codon:yes stop_codon:yes gene_type:complete